MLPSLLRLSCVLLWGAVLASPSGCPEAAAGQDGVNPRAAALKEFGDRTQAYMELHHRLAARVPPLLAQATAEQIQRHQIALANAIRSARPRARQGEIFTPPVVPQFRTVIRADLRSRDTRQAMAAMQQVPPTVAINVNDHWPANIARGTVPPRLLNSLYRLPEGLEYRFLGRHLVLVDSTADLIVDYISNVVPSVIRRR
jgi:hypothetical protein